MYKASVDLRRILVCLCLAAVLTPASASLLSPSAAFPSSPPSPDVPSSDGDDVRRGTSTEHHQKPNIIIILADDMGWNDVSFHGSDQIPTPNIDALAYNGVILNSHYVSALCTPSRASLLTGKYPIRLGMQHSVILSAEPRGLPLSEKLLPQYLKEAGYKTHAIGKWHLGFFKKEYTPTFRGFDTHFGYWNGFQDYYNHSVVDTTEQFADYIGYDMRRNLTVDWKSNGKYSTDLFTEEAVHLINAHDKKDPMFMYLAHLAPHAGNDYAPLQAPDDEIAKFSYIKNPERRVYAAMVSKVDQSVGEVMSALRNRGMLENSIIMFLSDNGGATSGILMNHGSNYPLRGMKESPWEGGVRGVAAIWSPLIKESKRISNQLFHITDWLPTLLSAAGIHHKKLRHIDGKDLWPTLVFDKTSPRTQIVINIDDIDNYSAYRRGDFKYILGMTSTGSAWEGESGRPNNYDDEGVPPVYDPRDILQSKAGVAIAGVITAGQVLEMKERRKRRANNTNASNAFKNDILNENELLKLRKEATVECNVAEEDRIPCDPYRAPCLFDIVTDPCEMINLADKRPWLLANLEIDILKYRSIMLPPANVDEDPEADPRIWNNTWTNWRDSDPLAMGYTVEETPKYSKTGVAIVAVIVGMLIVAIMILFAHCQNKGNIEQKNNLRSHESSDNLSTTTQSVSSLSENLQNIKDMSTINNLVKNMN